MYEVTAVESKGKNSLRLIKALLNVYDVYFNIFMQHVLMPMYIVHILYLKLLNVYKRFHKLLIIKNMMDRSKIKTNIYKLKFHFELRIYFVFL